MSSSQLILKTGNAVLDCFDNIYLLFCFFGFLRKFEKKCLVGVNFHEPTLVTFFTLISYMIC